MIIFDQLRISSNGQTMYIDAHVNQSPHFSETTIEKLCICLAKDVVETIDPESIPNIYSKQYDSATTKEIHEAIAIDDENLTYNKPSFKDLFFVYIKCANVPEDKDCYTAVGNYVVGVTFNTTVLYQAVMQYTKDLNRTCEIPKNFINLILLWNGFKAAVETGHYLVATDFYNKMFKGNALTAASSINNICGCHG